jgi:transcriptional regulator with XRE-family HTH domain
MTKHITPQTFRAIRIKLCLSQDELAAILRIEDRRSISRYENGKRGISGPVSLLMEHLDMYGLGYLPGQK